MQVVHVLRDQKPHSPQLLKLNKGVMAFIGLKLALGHFHGQWRQPLFLARPDTVGAAIVEQPGFRADPRTGEENRMARLVDPCG